MRTDSFVKTVIIFLLIYVSDDTIIFGTNSSKSSFLIKITIFIALMLTVIIRIYILNIKIPKRYFELLIIIIIMILATAIFNRDIKFGYYYHIFHLTLAFFVTIYIPLDEMLLKYDKVMFIITVISIFGYLLEVSNVAFYKNFPVIINISNNKFYNLLLTTIIAKNMGVPRNYSFFREPGVFQMFLILALIVQLFYFKNMSIKKVVVYVAALLTTKSTTGYIALAILLIVYVFKNYDSKKQLFRKIFILTLSLISFVYLLLKTDIIISKGTYGSVFGKFINNYEYRSLYTRVSSVMTNIKIFLLNPFFGMGSSKVRNLFPTMEYVKMGGYSSSHNTNHVLAQFSTYGFLLDFLIW